MNLKFKGTNGDPSSTRYVDVDGRQYDTEWLPPAIQANIEHACAMFPKLVEALEEIERLTTTYSESSLSFGVISKKAAAVLAEAHTPEVSKSAEGQE